MTGRLTALSPAMRNVFVLPVVDKYLVYAPLHQTAALVDEGAITQLAHAARGETVELGGELQELWETLSTVVQLEPHPPDGEMVPPFLGILPTRACNLACHYCSFWSEDGHQTQMSLNLARDSIDWYFDVLERAGRTSAEVHFFGGEPFSAPRVVDFCVYHARRRALAAGIDVRFEATSNGAYPEHRARWIADHFSAVVLSLDGPPEIHDRHRPRPGGRGSFEEVARNARIFAAGQIELCLRACVTRDTVHQMPEIAEWFCREFRPEVVCFEAIDFSDLARRANLYPPDPVD